MNFDEKRRIVVRFADSPSTFKEMTLDDFEIKYPSGKAIDLPTIMTSVIFNTPESARQAVQCFEDKQKHKPTEKWLLIFFNYGAASPDYAGLYIFDSLEEAQAKKHHLRTQLRHEYKGDDQGEERRFDVLADIADSDDKIWGKIIKISGDNISVDWLKEGGLTDPQTKLDFEPRKKKV